MATIVNPSFEIAGPTPGSAFGWVMKSKGSALDYAGKESFETGYGQEGYSQTITSKVLAPTESFDDWNGSADYSPTITALSAAVHAPTVDHPSGAPFEDFRFGYSGCENYSPTITSSVAAPAEDFSTGWNNNQNYSTTITSKEYGSTEDFSSVLLDQEFTVVGAPTDVLTAPGHVLPNDAVVYAQTTNTLPSGLQKLVKMYVVQVVAGVSFKLSLTSGGTPITVTDTGIGTHNTHGDPDLYWTVQLTF